MKLKNINNVLKKEADNLLSQPKGTKTDLECPECKAPMTVRQGITKFFGCSTYPKCKCMVGVTKSIQKPIIPNVDLRIDYYSDIGEVDGQNDLNDVYPNEIYSKDDM